MRVGFDIGGTFTDIIVLGDDGEIVTDKVLSLLERVGEDVAACVRPLARTQQVESFVHGTTVASNAVIEGTAARTGLITTRGFRDDLEMRGQRRPNIYDLNWDRLPSLVPRSLRLEVRERILGTGKVEQPLDLEEARAAIKTLVASLSCDIHPEIREYDRASTTVINASLIPVVDRYLNGIEKPLNPLSKRLLVMQSNGGIMTGETARRRPAMMPPFDCIT